MFAQQAVPNVRVPDALRTAWMLIYAVMYPACSILLMAILAVIMYIVGDRNEDDPLLDQGLLMHAVIFVIGIVSLAIAVCSVAGWSVFGIDDSAWREALSVYIITGVVFLAEIDRSCSPYFI